MRGKELISSKLTEIRQVVAKSVPLLFFPSFIKVPLIHAASLVDASANLLLAVFSCGAGEPGNPISSGKTVSCVLCHVTCL